MVVGRLCEPLGPPGAPSPIGAGQVPRPREGGAAPSRLIRRAPRWAVVGGGCGGGYTPPTLRQRPGTEEGERRTAARECLGNGGAGARAWQDLVSRLVEAVLTSSRKVAAVVIVQIAWRLQPAPLSNPAASVNPNESLSACPLLYSLLYYSMSQPDTSKPDIPSIVTTDLSSTINVSPPLDDDHVELDIQPPTPTDQQLLSASPTYLSPSGASGRRSSVSGQSSLEAPYSPTLSPTLGQRSPSPSYAGSISGSSQHVPPSPTLSAHSSVHFASALALRDNKPDQRDGISSLGLLSPNAGYNKHRRKGSVASSVGSDGTEPDAQFTEYGMVSVTTPRHEDEYKSLSVPPSPTHTHFDQDGAASEFDGTTMRSRSGSAHSRAKLISPRPSDEDNDATDASKKGKGVDDGAEDGDADDKDAPRPALDLSADDAIDAGPFAVKPYRLASLVDPKSLSSLEQLGGVKGLLEGLGTHAKTGLSAAAIGKAPGHRHDAGTDTGAGEGASQRHDRPKQTPEETDAEAVPGIVVTGPGSEVDVSRGKPHSADGHEEEDEGEKVYNASLEERRRVFGANVLPTRKTKSLLQLMWLALKDKVLVRIACSLPCFDDQFLTACVGALEYRCRRIFGAGIFPRLRHTKTRRRAAGGLGGRCGHYCRDSHCGAQHVLLGAAFVLAHLPYALVRDFPTHHGSHWRP